jgi:hypothetical protein
MLEAIWGLITSTFVWGFVAGLIIGWNFLSQPAWVARLVNKTKG